MQNIWVTADSADQWGRGRGLRSLEHKAAVQVAPGRTGPTCIASPRCGMRWMRDTIRA